MTNYSLRARMMILILAPTVLPYWFIAEYLFRCASL